jgi:hypothetical protein
MNWQLTTLKKDNPNKNLKKKYTRKECAMNVAICYQKGRKVQERILRLERGWVRHRKMPISGQGKNSKMLCMLEDEGTMIAVQEFLATAGQGKNTIIIFIYTC